MTAGQQLQQRLTAFVRQEFQRALGDALDAGIDDELGVGIHPHQTDADQGIEIPLEQRRVEELRRLAAGG